MVEKPTQIRLLYVVLAVLLLVGLLPLAVAGILLSRRSAEQLRSVEGRYQAQLVQDKARQIELYGQRYRDVVSGVARAFEIAGGIRLALLQAPFPPHAGCAGKRASEATGTRRRGRAVAKAAADKRPRTAS